MSAAPAHVEAEADPRQQGRTAFRVTSLYSPNAVQAAIDDLMNAEGVVFGEFTRVVRVVEPGRAACWRALGWTLVAQTEAA